MIDCVVLASTAQDVQLRCESRLDSASAQTANQPVRDHTGLSVSDEITGATPRLRQKYRCRDKWRVVHDRALHM